MAVAHIVWIKFQDRISSARVDEHLADLASLQDSIPEISRMTLGENFTDRADGFTHGLVVELQDRAGLAAYAAHPRHVEVATALREDADYLVMDYEF